MKNHVIAIFVIVVFLSACNNEAAVVPTPDFDEVRTQAVQTAMMDMTAQAVLHPTATPIPSTNSQITMTANETVIPVTNKAGSGSSSEMTIPTSTPGMYDCEYVTQNPLDKPQMTGNNYVMVWTIRNAGLATWNMKEYYVKWLGGSDISPKHTYPLEKNVAPNDTLDIRVDIQIPTNPTSVLQVTRWGIVNDNGDVFCKFFHAIPSTYSPSPTKTPTK
jgi:hypothetical protein